MPGVLTIRRPDLVKAPKLKFPLRLPSMVIRPAPALRAPVAPRLERPLPASQSEAMLGVLPNEPAPPKPKLSIDARSVSAAPRRRDLEKPTNIPEPNLQASSATTDPQAKSVVVINAVVVPPKPDLVIPDSELNSRFVLGPSSQATGSIEPQTAGNIAATRASNRGADFSDPNAASGVELHSRTGDRSGSNSKVAGGENNSLPGISISGGVTGRSGRSLTTSSTPRGSYALTIISGGSSGGASRDLGTFARTDTVYTIYIPMNDAGGGPEWPMQYALVTPLPNASPSDFLTPPIVIKKVSATLPATYLTANPGLAFLTGVIEANGKLESLHAVRTTDAKAQAAIRSLAQWEFQPAQVMGTPVPCKILIGVNVTPTDEGETPQR